MVALRKQEDKNGARLVAGLAGYALSVQPEDILAPGRGAIPVARARQVAMYLAHVGLGMSLARVADAFDRDRSTVAHGCHLVEDWRDEADFNAWMECLEDSLASLEPVAELVR